MSDKRARNLAKRTQRVHKKRASSEKQKFEDGLRLLEVCIRDGDELPGPYRIRVRDDLVAAYHEGRLRKHLRSLYRQH